MRVNIGEKISDLCQLTIGHRPVIIGESGRGRVIQFEFDPDLTPAERTTVLNAMPDWIRKLYDFSRKTGTLRPEP